MKKNRRSKNKRNWYYNGKIAGGYSLNRNPRGVLFEPAGGMEILDAAKAAYHLALHHKIDVVMNFNGVKLNVTCQNGAKPENIARKYYSACNGKTR